MSKSVPWYAEESGFFGPAYLAEYAERVSPERTRAEVDFLETRIPLQPGTRILDLACGHGRHSIELAKRGYCVTGQDLNRTFLQKAFDDAAAAGVSVEWRCGDMRLVHAPNAVFDVVLNLFTSFGYFETEEDDLQVLREVVRVLCPGGVFALDVINAWYIARHFEPYHQAWGWDGPGSLTQRFRSFDAATGRLRERVLRLDGPGREQELHLTHRAYLPTELIRLLRDVGLAVSAQFGAWDGSPLTWDTKRCILFARKS